MYTSLFQEDIDPEAIERVLGALASEPRRLTLGYFEDSDAEVASLDDLAEKILAQQDETDITTIDRARLRLYHVDIPKLEAADLVDYESEAQTVCYRGPPAEVENDEWARYLTQQVVA